MKKYLLFAVLSLVLFSCSKEKKQQDGIVFEEKQLVAGRQVPERKDDFAWENDRAAFRVYGPALANENPSSGIDMWFKKTEKLVMDRFYKGELEDGLSYHEDRGEGMDAYKVGHTLGAGGISPYADGKIWVENHYTTAEVLSLTPTNITFQLTYDSVQMGDKYLNKKVVVSLDAGSQFNKATVTYDGDFDAIQLAAGVFLHQELGTVVADQENGTIAYAEKAIAERGNPDAGRCYTGVIFTTPVVELFQDDVHAAGIVDYKKGEELVYYFGGGWSEWGFDSDQAWFDYVKNFKK
ncbi:DUF4861 domain-containing protein [Bacteroidales bacterium OttesenSCG-928-J19]|nr:DUF4861 domain-containing protein [Bacteroidales bacterium OttesenSCG-928-J19]